MNIDIAESIPAEFAGEPGWEPLNMPRQFGEGRSFVSGSVEDDRVTIYYFWNPAERTLMATVRFGPGAEGPIHHAHGGAMAAVLDECMGFSAWVSGHSVVAANIGVNFLRKAPLHSIHRVEARVDAVVDTKVTTRARLFDVTTGKDFAESNGLFIIQPLEKFGELVRARGMLQQKKGPR